MTHVSVIMVAGSKGDRSASLRRTLQSWSKVTYPDFDFTLVDNGCSLKFTPEVIKEFPVITRYVMNEVVREPINRIWRREGKASTGEYIIFAMGDELLGNYDIINIMLSAPKDRRCSINTWFLNNVQTIKLDQIDWLDNPKLIEQLPGFWVDKSTQNTSNRDRHSGGLLTHITGGWRDFWEWINWFRDDDFGSADGYLLIDRDIHVRETAANRSCYAISNDCVCYHQWHPGETTHTGFSGFAYENEKQARLLEPARRIQ